MSTVKPEIALLTLENIIGNPRFKFNKGFYNKYNLNMLQVNHFLKLSNKKYILDYFFENVFMKAGYFDYRIKYVKKVNKNNYDVYAER
jgi:hypothetical protein